MPSGPLSVEVRAVEWLGHECLISATAGDAPVIIRQVGMSADAVGSTLQLHAEPGHVHLFDKQTTERLS